jgi:3-polyprenyl-4-hydroxybenzoate decarboxylase
MTAAQSGRSYGNSLLSLTRNEEIVDHTVGRILDLFDIEVGRVRRWAEDPGLLARPVKSEE